jgi:hypothetical protein
MHCAFKSNIIEELCVASQGVAMSSYKSRHVALVCSMRLIFQALGDAAFPHFTNFFPVIPSRFV